MQAAPVWDRPGTLKMGNAASVGTPEHELGRTARAEARGVFYAMRSDPGRIRSANEDFCAALPEHGVFVVCDGMGGCAAGEIASQLAAEAFLNHLSRRQQTEAANGSESSSAPRTRLLQAVRAANQAVFQRAQRSSALKGMGTTLVALLWQSLPGDPNPILWLAHVGDSRAYRIRGGTAQQITVDHSLVEEQVRAGLIDRMQAESSPVRNIITRAIGTQATVEIDIVSHPAQRGDLYLLASDGLTRELSEVQIAELLARYSVTELDAACEALVDAANRHGGRDNITVLLVACP